MDSFLSAGAWILFYQFNVDLKAFLTDGICALNNGVTSSGKLFANMSLGEYFVSD